MWRRLKEFQRSRASMIFECHYFQISLTVTDYRGHCRTLFLLREISLMHVHACMRVSDLKQSN